MAVPQRRDITDVVEGFYASQAVWALHKLGVLPRLATAAEVPVLADEFSLDERTLAAVLDYVHRTTGLLELRRTGYRLAPGAMPYNVTAFHLEKFLGAYGPAVARTAEILRDPATGVALRDFDALALAFAQLEPKTPSLTAQLLQAWSVSTLLDLGCGTGTLLIELAAAEQGFRGYGVDASDAMVCAAADRVHRSGFDGRIRVQYGDVRVPSELPALPESAQVQALYGRSIMNEFFAETGRAARVLAGLKARYPGRLLFLEDYYGRLAAEQPVHDTEHSHGLAQDLAQVLTGQGVPPPDLAGWDAVYRAAGCALVKAYEGDNDGIEWFIHVVQL